MSASGVRSQPINGQEFKKAHSEAGKYIFVVHMLGFYLLELYWNLFICYLEELWREIWTVLGPRGLL